ncbi:MAG: ABC transporter ATP-binding protein [Acholeplasmataceae bacterium]|nr:ABC transporter ATP-binding protein [Acholeplasmataceae bacterium]
MREVKKNLKLVSRLSPGFIFCHVLKAVLSSLLPFVNIIFSYLILDGLIIGTDKETLYLQISIMISLDLVIGLLLIVINYFIKKKSTALYFNLSNTISMKAINIDYELQEKQEVMDLIKKAEEGINGTGDFDYYLNQIFNSFLSNALKIFYASILLIGLFKIYNDSYNTSLSRFLNNPFSGLIIILVVVLNVIISTHLHNKLEKISYEAVLRNIEGNRKFGYLFRININYKLGKDIRLYHMQDMILATMKDKRFTVEAAWVDFMYSQIRFERINRILGHVLMFSAYAFVGLKAIYGFISVGEVLRYVSAIIMLSGAITGILMAIVNIKIMNTYLTHYDTFLNLESKMVYGNEDIDTSNLVIEFKDVNFKYPDTENYILKNINLKITPYEKLALVGENGAGKTTFFKLLSRLYDIEEGEILINGKNISNYKKEAINKLFAIVFQDFRLFSYSIKDNITIGKEDCGVREVLIEAGFKEKLDKLGEKIETILYNRSFKDGIELSGGEEQKIAIARALYKDAPFMILDEPTSALDPLAEEEIYLKFNEITKNKTSIFISHRMSSCKFCDKIIVLDKGEIIETGSHKELMKNKGKYYELFSAQAKYYN